jgi:hypothetical protein
MMIKKERARKQMKKTKQSLTFDIAACDADIGKCRLLTCPNNTRTNPAGNTPQNQTGSGDGSGLNPQTSSR